MNMIVADLFRMQLFPDFALLGGTSGLNRRLLSVSVIDAPDVDRWMRGGEFLVGSGYIFRDNPQDLIPFMERANARGTAALGIKLDRYHHNLTKEIQGCADRLSFPLLQIPLNYRWTDIIESVYTFLDRERRGDPHLPPNLDQFWEEGIEPEQLLSEMSRKLERSIIAISPLLNLNHLFLPNGHIEGGGQVQDFLAQDILKEKSLPSKGGIEAHLELRNPKSPYWVAISRTPRDIPMTLYLRLIEGEHTPSALQSRLLLRAITLLRAVTMEKEALTPKTETGSQRFFEGLCLDTYTDRDMIRANLEELKIILPSASRVTIITSLNNNRPLYTPQNAVLSYTLGNSWIGLLPLKDSEETAPLLSQMAEKHQLLIAMGSIVRDVLEISRSFREARRTLKWVLSFALLAGAYLHDELSLFALLESLSRFPEAMDVWKYYWEPLTLEGKGTRRSLSLEKFVRALVQADFNAKLCSKQLHLHYNTVRNYTAEVEELLDLDLTSPHHRLGLSLAYHINRSMKNDISLGGPVDYVDIYRQDTYNKER